MWRAGCRRRCRGSSGAGEVGDDLVDQRPDRRAAAVHDALPADLDHVDPRQDRVVRRRFGGALYRLVTE